jgi:two-component system phosphate regulon response regulator PhoB
MTSERFATDPNPRRIHPIPMKPRVLVVDDEPDVVELLEFNLAAAGMEVISALNGAEALTKMRTHQPQLVILDVMMPEMDGLEVCKLMRRDPASADTPVIFLTARAAEIDRILGLELGADDYVTKPFSPRELVLRVKGLLRRGAIVEEPGERLAAGELAIDVARHRTTVKEREVPLTATEFRLLTCLLKQRGRVLTREVLLRDVWGYHESIDTRTVDTHMRRLREKLGAAARFLDTVRGVGYRFQDD